MSKKSTRRATITLEKSIKRAYLESLEEREDIILSQLADSWEEQQETVSHEEAWGKISI
jgi:hypothetical protein